MDNTMERKRLIDCLPPFPKQFREIREIMRVANDETDNIDKQIQWVLNSAFILDCDEYGIKKYENMLNIKPSSKDTLDSRKKRVLTRWNEFLPYTYRTLLRKLNLLCGNDFEVFADFETDYRLVIITHLGTYGQVEEVNSLLERILPQNIVIETKNVVELQAEDNLYQGLASAITWNYEIF